MPKAFENCVAKHGKIVTQTVRDGRYRHICYLNGKAYPGELKTKQKPSNERKK